MVRSKLYQLFAETSLENVDLTETKPCLYFVYMERGNQSQELRVNYANSNNSVTHFDCNHLAHVIVLWQMQKSLCYCTVFALIYFEFEGNFLVQAPQGEGGLYLEGRFNERVLELRVWGAYIWRGLYTEGLIFGILRYSKFAPRPF